MTDDRPITDSPTPPIAPNAPNTGDTTLNLQRLLAEIDSLKQHITAADREAESARESADRWRQLYTQEASQRRHDRSEQQAEIDRLKADLSRFKDVAQTPATAHQLSTEIAELSLAELRDRLVSALLQCDALTQQIATLETDLGLERAEHAKTRSDLTSALGDTVEVFARTKAKMSQPAGEAAAHSPLPPSRSNG